MYGNKIDATGDDCVIRLLQGHKSSSPLHNSPTCTYFILIMILLYIHHNSLQKRYLYSLITLHILSCDGSWEFCVFLKHKMARA